MYYILCTKFDCYVNHMWLRGVSVPLYKWLKSAFKYVQELTLMFNLDGG